MPILNKTVKDKITFEFNPLTGKFDLVSRFNSDRILTHEYNQAGSLLMTYDARSGQQIPMGPLVVTDNNGNVVVVG